MKTIDEEFLEALQRGIDHERVACGQEPGAPYSGGEWDCAAATTLAINVLSAPFHQRRAVLFKLALGLFGDGFFRPAGDNDML